MDQQSPPSAPATWGGPQQMSAWDGVMWRAEGDPRTSSTGLLVELLDVEPDWESFVTAHHEAVALIPRLSERVVEPALPITPPVWSPDRDFDLTRHLARVDLGGSGTHADLLAFCERSWTEPLDAARPPWTATLVRGLADGTAAYVLKCHHSMTDGMGLVQLLDLTHDHGRTPVPRIAPVPPARPEVSPAALTLRAVARGATGGPASAVAAAARAARVVRTPLQHTHRAVRYARSLGRLLGEVPERSPLLKANGAAHRLLMLELDLVDLKAAGRAVGGSVNDAYVAAILGGLRRYHEHFDVHVDSIPVAMPVSLRSDDDPAGGNRFAGVRFGAPLAERDPAERIRRVGAYVREVRKEPAIGYLEPASMAMSRLPRPAIVELTARATSAADLQISNIPGLRRPAYIAGARVVGTFPFGPRPGVAAMVTMMTYDGRCCIGLTLDANAFPEPAVLRRCLEEGFEEVLALAAHREQA